MLKKLLSLIITLILVLSFAVLPVYAEDESSVSNGTTEEDKNVGVLEILTCTEGYTSIAVGKYTYPKNIVEVIQLIPNVGYHVYGVEINGVFKLVENDTVSVPINVGEKVTVNPVFRGNLIFNIEQNEGGKLIPEGTVYVGTGNIFEITAQPDSGYTCTGIFINDVGLDIKKENNVFKGSFKAPKEKAYTVYATFEPMETHTITLTKNEGGKVLPFNEEGVAYALSGDTAQFQILPDEGYGIKSVTANGKDVTWSADGVFSVPNVSSDFSVSVEFVQMESIPVKITNIGKGSITPAEKAYFNTTLVLDVMPEKGYELVSIKINGKLTKLNKDGRLEIAINEEIQSLDKLEIEALFDVVAEKYVIRAIVQNSIGGVISADGYTIENMKTEVRKGGSITLSFTPDMNYIIEKVKIDGVEVQLSENNTYTLKNISSAHNIIAYFTPDLSNGDDFFKITISARNGGTVSPIGEQLVKPGADLNINFKPDNGYIVDYIIVDGTTQIYSENVFVFEKVISNHSLEVGFKKADGIDNNIDWNASEIIVDISENTLVNAELFNQLSVKAHDKKVIFNGKGYSWSFEAGSDFPKEDFDFNLLIGKEKVDSTVITALENKMIQNNIQGFEYEVIKTCGVSLPSEATITLNLKSTLFEKELDYLFYDDKTGKFSSVFNSVNESKLTVGDSGKVSFKYNGNKYLILVVSSSSKFKIEVIVGEHGSASPRGTSTVLINTTQNIQISPDPGYMVEDIIVNGTSMFQEHIGKTSSFSISLGKISNNYKIEVKFTPSSENSSNGDISSSNGPNGGFSPLTVTLIIIGIAILGGVILFVYKWNAEKDIVD